MRRLIRQAVVAAAASQQRHATPSTRMLTGAAAVGFVIGSAVTLFGVLEMQHDDKHHHKPERKRRRNTEDEMAVVVEGGTSEATVVASRIFPIGIPKPAEHVVAHAGYVSCFNKMTKNPSWACVRLNKEMLHQQHHQQRDDEVVDRHKSDFHQDKTLAKPFRTQPEDFLKSGYDRGHLVAASDVRMSQAAMNETFSLSNISPQVGEGFNRGFWAALEQFARDLTQVYADVYACTGPLFLPEFDASTKQWRIITKVIGPYNYIFVPTHFFKCLLCVANDGVTKEACFVVPNRRIDPTKESLESFVVPRSRVERWCGLELFPTLTAGGGNTTPPARLCDSEKCELKRQVWKNGGK